MANSRTASLAAIAIGLAVVPVKLIYSFFPLFNLIDVLLFAALGWLWGRRSASADVIQTLQFSAPAMVLCTFFLIRLGAANLMRGVGVGWFISLVIIPLATYGGMRFAASQVRHSSETG